MVHRSTSATGKRSTKHDRRMSHVIVKKGVWDRMEDPATKRIFYHNSVTGETSWNRPDGFRDGVDQDEAKKRVTRGWRVLKERAAFGKKCIFISGFLSKIQPVGEPLFNHQTGASQWEEPRGSPPGEGG